MESKDGGVDEIDRLEKGLLSEEDEEEPVLYSASFEEAEEKFLKLKTTQWMVYSLLLILAWGLGLLMLLYTPVRRYVLRCMIRSRKLYVTPNAIVYKVSKPVAFPCVGVLKKEKHVLLASVGDIVIEQGYLQSRFGVYSIRIENVGVRRPPSDDVQIEGIANPWAFRKFVSNMTRQASMMEEAMKSKAKSPMHNAGEFAILQKLEEVGNSLKRVQTLIQEQST